MWHGVTAAGRGDVMPRWQLMILNKRELQITKKERNEANVRDKTGGMEAIKETGAENAELLNYFT